MPVGPEQLLSGHGTMRERGQVHDQVSSVWILDPSFLGSEWKSVSGVGRRREAGSREGLCFPLPKHLQFQPPIRGSKIILAPHAVSVSGTDYLLC